MTPLPNVQWSDLGEAPLDWRLVEQFDEPDNDEERETPPDVIEMLGFDPRTQGQFAWDAGWREIPRLLRTVGGLNVWENEPAILESMDAEFREEEHPRGEGGQFGEGTKKAHSRFLSGGTIRIGNRKELNALKLAMFSEGRNGAPDHQSFPVRKVPISSLVATQNSVGDKVVDKHLLAGTHKNSKTDAYAIKHRGKYFIIDGHHTAEAAVKGGSPYVTMHVEDLDDGPPAAHDSQPLALDRASVRFDDKDGRMHVKLTPISKAAVNDYVGKEIPGWEELGLDPDRVYKMLRHPDELKKAAHTFNNLPILSRHQPTSAVDHPKHLTEGSTGTDAQFNGDYLWNSLVAWTQDAIDGIRSNRKRELSSGYHYRPDMTPGVWKGQRYDGVMRDIVGNHVAFVEEGRAGPDVLVGDSKEKLKMATRALSSKAVQVHGALFAFLAPKIAQDQSLNLAPALADITNENYDSMRPRLLRSVSKLIDGKLAYDASSEGLATLLDALSGEKPLGGKDLETDPNAGLPPRATRNTEEGPGAGHRNIDRGSDDSEDPMAMGEQQPAEGEPGEEEEEQNSPGAQVKAWLAANLPPEKMQEFEQFMASLQGGGQEEGEENPEAYPGEEPVEDEEPDGLETKEATGPKFEKGQVAEQPKGSLGKDKRMHAMDAAAVRKTVDDAVLAERENNRRTREAYEAVEPWVGKIKIALDTPDAVYRQALKMRGRDVSKVRDAAALPIILHNLPKIGEVDGRDRRSRALAQDAADADSYSKKWPDAVKITL